MDDVFARIGRAFAHLKANSTLVGAPAEEVARLARELETFEAGINAQIQELVQRATETALGQILSLENRFNDLAAQIAGIDTGLETVAEALEEAPIEPVEPAEPAALEPAAGEPVADPAPEPVLEPAPAAGDDTVAGGDVEAVSGDQPADAVVEEPVIEAPVEPVAEEPVAEEAAPEPAAEPVAAEEEAPVTEEAAAEA